MPALKDSLAALNRTQIEFVLTEIDLGMTFCRIARQRGAERSSRSIGNARKAYQAATKYMFHLWLTDQEFNAIAANVERLKFEVESLEAKYNQK